MTDEALQVAILFNAPVLSEEDPARESEVDVIAVAKIIGTSLARAGFRVWEVVAQDSLIELVEQLSQPRPDVVFNLIEGFGGRSAGEVYVTGLLELLGLAYTGCSPAAQSLGHSKSRTKMLLRGAGLPTAPFLVLRSDEPVSDWVGTWPVIVKPDAEDASLGIDQRSIVKVRADLDDAVDRLRATHPGDVLIETYLPGREFNVGLLALPDSEVLPIAEIVYDLPDDAWPILTYDAKWSPGSAADQGSAPQCPAKIDDGLARELRDLAVAAFHLTGCRDYARVDFRLDAAGRPHILEVNPNPDLGPTAGWARALLAAGLDYDLILASLTNQAWHRAEKGSHE